MEAIVSFLNSLSFARGCLHNRKMVLHGLPGLVFLFSTGSLLLVQYQFLVLHIRISIAKSIYLQWNDTVLWVFFLVSVEWHFENSHRQETILPLKESLKFGWHINLIHFVKTVIKLNPSHMVPQRMTAMTYKWNSGFHCDCKSQGLLTVYD